MYKVLTILAALVPSEASGPPVHEVAQFVGSDSAANDWFGFSVSISGNIIVVGAPYEDTDGFLNSGSAYVFQTTGEGATWTQTAKLAAADAAAVAEWEARGGDAPAIAGSAVVAAYPGVDPAESAGDAEEEEPAAAAAPAAPEPPLPDGWRSQLDPASGVDFYVHDESGATQWQRPSD